MPFVDLAVGAKTGFVDANDVYDPEYTRPETQDETAILKDEETKEQASARINNQASETFLTTSQANIYGQQDPNKVATDIADGESKLFGIYSKDDLYIEDDVISKSPAYTAAEHRFYRNLQILTEEMESAATEQEGKGIIGYGVDLVDREVVRATLFGWYENLTNRTAREGSRVLSNLVENADPKEMRKFAKEYVDEIRSEGVLKGENAFSYAQMLREVYGLGYNPDAAWDRMFGVLDLAGFVGGASKIAKITKLKALKSTTAASRAGALGGAEEANQVARKIFERDIDPVNTADMQASAVSLNKAPVRPSQGFMQKLRETNEIIERTAKGIREGAIPTAARSVDANAAAKIAADKFAKSFKTNLYDTVIDDIDEQTKSVSFLIGKNTDGLPFKPFEDGTAPTGAHKIAERVGGDVVPLDPEDLSQGYVIKVSQTLDLSKGISKGLDIKLTNSLWKSTLGRIVDNPIVASPAARDVAELNELALRSQSGSKYLNTEAGKHLKTIEKLNYEDSTLLDTILTELRDGSKKVDLRSWNETEFAAQWTAKTGEAPSKEVMEAFKAAETLSDAAYYFRSMEIMKTYVKKGYANSVKFSDGVYIPAKRTTVRALKEDAKVLDAENGVKLYGKEIDNVDPDTVVWELSTEWEGQSYVLFPEEVRLIDPTDVLGYSAYGRRTNPELRYFVFLQGDAGIKTVLGTFSSKSAQVARDQLKSIQEAYLVGEGDSVIEAAIRNNNDWNPNINSKADMDEWLTENGIDITKGDLFAKPRDESINDPFDKVFGTENAGDYVNNQMARSETVLTEYGGNKAYNPSPLDSITQQYGTEAHRYASSYYTMRSMQGWINQIKIMREEGIPLSVEVAGDIDPNDFRKLFLNTKITGSSPAERRMKEIQDTIKRRLNMSQSSVEEEIKRAVDASTEALYDAWGVKVNPSDPTSLLLKNGFFSAFAFNLSQAFLQSSQIINIVAVSGQKIGFKAAAGQVHLRKILSMSDDVAVEKLGLANFAKSMEISEEAAREIATLFRQVQPNQAMADAIELGTGINTGRSVGKMFGKTGFYATKVGRKMWDIGLKPFNFGDGTAKSTAFMAAALEFKRANPAVSLLSEAGRNYVARRSETLTQNMSNTSRSALQSGVGKVPTQWLSYFFRTTEQVFIGRDLTMAERAKLGFFLMPFYGFTGLGMPFVAEKVAEHFNLDPLNDTDRALFITMKYGILDGFLNHFTPFDVALSERMAPVTAVFDIYDKFTEESVLSAVGGPSGSIAYSGGEALYNLMSNVVNGYTSTTTEDTMRILRNFSGINAAAKATGIVADGVYRNRRGIPLPLEMEMTDAIISATGFTPLQVTEFYGQTGRSIDLGREVKAIQKEVREKGQLAWSIYKEDPARASKIIQDTAALVSKSPLSYTKKMEILRQLQPNINDYSSILRTLHENDKMYSAQWAASLLQKD